MKFTQPKKDTLLVQTPQENETLLENTQHMMNLVTQDSFEVVRQLQIAGKSRSSNALIKSTYLVTAKILLLEILVLFYKLPSDVQDRIREFIEEKLYLNWYFEFVSNKERQWRLNPRAFYRDRMFEVSFDPNTVTNRKDDLVQVWKLGMVGALEAPPCPETFMFTQFSKFQQSVFRKLYNPHGKDIAPIHVTSAISEFYNGHLKAPHFLIIIRERRNFISYNCDWYKDRLQPDILTEPAKVRARGFSLIVQEATELANVGYRLIHYGRTTFAIPLQWVEEIIVPGLPYDYIKRVESGAYLSPRGRNFLAEYLIAQDEEEFKRMMASGEYDDDDDYNYDLANLMGDEGVHNLENMLEA